MVSTRSQSLGVPNSKVSIKPEPRRKPGSKAQKEKHKSNPGSKRDEDAEGPSKKKAKSKDEGGLQKQEYPTEHAFQVGRSIQIFCLIALKPTPTRLI